MSPLLLLAKDILLLFEKGFSLSSVLCIWVRINLKRVLRRHVIYSDQVRLPLVFVKKLLQCGGVHWFSQYRVHAAFQALSLCFRSYHG